jgi:UDPglucose 6-dehydrogenase
LARLCERVGADAADVERGLRSDPRVGQRAYVSAGPPIAGGTLARDVTLLKEMGKRLGVSTPLVDAIGLSNQLHGQWARDRLTELLSGVVDPRVALLGLTYKPHTNTLRRSAALELATWLAVKGVSVHAFDPAISELPLIYPGIELAESAEAALDRADAAVVATGWPQFRALTAATLVGRMRRPQVVDQAGLLTHLAGDRRIAYVRVGRPRGTTVDSEASG